MSSNVRILLWVAAGLVACTADAVGPLERFGASVPTGNAISAADVVRNPATMRDKTIIVEGIVRKVCQRKGCWMEVAASKDPDADGCRVTFENYGFFVPTNAIGAAARVHGTVVVTTLAAGHVAHLEAEGAHFSNKRADGSASEVGIVASGVEIRR